MAMKDEFYEYFEAIGITDPLLTQIRNMHLVAQGLLDEEIEATFIGDSTDQAGVRNYLYIFFFTKKRFAYFTLPNIAQCYIYGWKGFFPIASTTTENYDFRKATEASKLRLTLANEGFIQTRTRQTTILQATGNNCDYLFKIYKEIISPHL